MASDHYCLRAPAAEIRLLDLLEATPSGTLAGRLRRVAIDAAPSFISVSHVWGREKTTQPMHIESGCGNKTLLISQNLESFLIGLLSHDSTTLPQLWENGIRLPMWIDMACINQTDVSEKAAQIPLMRQIYSRANLVVIWIHEYDSYLRYAFQYFRRVLEDNRTSFDPVGWDAVKRFLSSEWFHRRWVIQEAVLPPSAMFLCGPHCLTMDDLFRSVDLITGTLMARSKELKLRKYATTGILRPLLALRKLHESLRKQHRPGLLWLLENLRSTQATLAHDQVYGLLGLCNSEEASLIPIRYDWKPEDLYKSCAITHVQLHQDIEFLALCTPAQRNVSHPGSSANELSLMVSGPTWVPNWQSRSLRRCLGPHGFEYDIQYFHAQGAIKTAISIDGDELAVTGVQLDRIQVLGNFCRPDRGSELSDPNSELLQQYFDFWMTLETDSTPYRDRMDKAEAFTRTLSLLGVYLNPIPLPEDVPSMFYRWCYGSTLGSQLEKCGFPPHLEAPIEGEKELIRLKRLLSWQPFITQKGYIGLAREQCSEGDEIWAIGGCSVPILLSQRDTQQSKREVRGEVFLDGFMFGETLNGPMNTLHGEKVILV